MPTQDENAGLELRDGRYAVTRTLGVGAQGDTLEAVDKRVGRLVAVKRFRVRGARQWKDVELAEREARVLASLSHPGLPAHVEHFEEGGALYLVMDKIDGESLAAIRRRGGSLGSDEVVRFLRHASSILDYLHTRAPPVIHRDIKPGNVIRRRDGTYAIVDFGAVRDRIKPEGGSTVVGTFGYMAPEQFQGRALPASDVYSVGATALALLTGEEPEALPHRGLALDVARALGPRADPALVAVLSAMLEPDPDKRPARIAPLLVRLGEPARGAEPPRRGTRDQRRARREAREPREDAREERRAARREERRARRRGGAWPGPPAPPGLPLTGPPLVLATLGLVLARLALLVALGVVVPVVLTVLSMFFGRGLRKTARRVREAGTRARATLRRAEGALRVAGREATVDARAGVAEGRARFDDDGGARVRVSGEGAARDPAEAAQAWGDAPWDDEAQRAAEAEAEAEAAAEVDAPRRGRSGVTRQR